MGQGEGQGAVREDAAVTPSRNAVSYKSPVRHFSRHRMARGYCVSVTVSTW